MVLADTSKGEIGWKKWVLTGWASFETFLFGGLIYGWGPLVFILKNEGIYADLCPRDISIDSNISIDSTNETTGTHAFDICEAQDNKMTLCFTIASAFICIGGAVFGHIYYKFGTRLTRILSFSFFITGSLMMAFISKERPWLMFPGLSLLAFGGIPLLVTNIQVSNLFLTGSSTVVGLMSGAVDSSSAVMIIVKIAAEKGFSRQHMFFIITTLHSMVLISTLFFLPKDFIMRPEFNKSQLEIQVTKDGQVEIESKDGQTNKPVNPKLHKCEDADNPRNPTLMGCVKKPMFITHVLWLCIVQLRFFVFIGSLNQYLNRVLNNEKNLDGKSARYREVMPAVLPLATASLLGVILSILVLIPGQTVLYVAFVIFTIYRSFIYSVFAAFLSTLFPIKLFGLLFGIAASCGAVFGLLQYGIFKWTEAYTEGPLHANIFLLLMLVLSLFHPIYLWISCWKEERKVIKQMMNVLDEKEDIDKTATVFL